MARPVRTVFSVDDMTGEITSSSTTYVSAPQIEPAYVKVYMDGMDGLRKIPLYCWPVLLWMLGRASYANEEQSLELCSTTRRRVAKDLDVSVSRVNHAVSDLVRCGIVLRVGRGLYRFNPEFFARGEWKDIQKLRSCGG